MFSGCSSLSYIHIPDSVTSIADTAFGCRSNLSVIEIPKSVTDFGVALFDGSKDLRIYGCEGSYAEAYAKEYDIPFYVSDGTPFNMLAGDVNCDDIVDISDAILLARYVAEDTRVSLTNSGKLNADVSGDGKYTAEDTSLIIRIIAQLG